MTIEDRIRTAAHQVADEVEPPTLDIDLVRRRAHAGRRRKVVIAAAVAATVAVCLLVPRLLGSPSSAPDPVDRPPGPVDPPPGQVSRSAPVWADADGLHLDNRVLDLKIDPQGGPACGLEPACTGISSLALVDSGVVYGDQESRQVWYQPLRGPAKEIGEGSVGGPAGDPDGTTAAWFDGTELVMYDTATGTELARATPPREENGPAEDEFTQPSPQRENAHGNLILEVDSEQVTWLAPAGRFHFDRRSAHTSLLPVDDANLDIHEGRLAIQNDDSTATEVFSSAGDTTLKVEPGRLIGPLRFGADGRYLAGVNERDGYGVTVADTVTGELFIPQYDDYYPWIGWGYGDTLMVIQDHEGTDDGNPNDKSQLLACDVSEQTCQRLNRRGAMTLPSG
jgi:hypothetical protein